jgi:hypothetical protein
VRRRKKTKGWLIETGGKKKREKRDGVERRAPKVSVVKTNGGIKKMKHVRIGKCFAFFFFGNQQTRASTSEALVASCASANLEVRKRAALIGPGQFGFPRR